MIVPLFLVSLMIPGIVLGIPPGSIPGVRAVGAVFESFCVHMGCIEPPNLQAQCKQLLRLHGYQVTMERRTLCLESIRRAEHVDSLDYALGRLRDLEMTPALVSSASATRDLATTSDLTSEEDSSVMELSPVTAEDDPEESREPFPEAPSPPTSVPSVSSLSANTRVENPRRRRSQTSPELELLVDQTIVFFQRHRLPEDARCVQILIIHGLNPVTDEEALERCRKADNLLCKSSSSMYFTSYFDSRSTSQKHASYTAVDTLASIVQLLSDQTAPLLSAAEIKSILQVDRPVVAGSILYAYRSLMNAPQLTQQRGPEFEEALQELLKSNSRMTLECIQVLVEARYPLQSRKHATMCINIKQAIQIRAIRDYFFILSKSAHPEVRFAELFEMSRVQDEQQLKALVIALTSTLEYLRPHRYPLVLQQLRSVYQPSTLVCLEHFLEEKVPLLDERLALICVEEPQTLLDHFQELLSFQLVSSSRTIRKMKSSFARKCMALFAPQQAIWALAACRHCDSRYAYVAVHAVYQSHRRSGIPTRYKHVVEASGATSIDQVQCIKQVEKLGRRILLPDIRRCLDSGR